MTSTVVSRFRDLLVVVAMEEEERAILEVLDDYPAESGMVGSRLKVSYRRFLVGDRRITLVRSGVGPVNAATTVVQIAESGPIDGVFLFGVGGAVSAKLEIGDVVVATDILQHDSFSSLDFGNARMRSGRYILSEADLVGHSPLRPADAASVAWIAGAFLERGFHRGVILSGNEFVGTVARKREIAALHPEALLVDMEAAGVAHVAERLGIPFLVVKTVSDRLSPDGTIENDFKKCLERAAANAATCLKTLIG